MGILRRSSARIGSILYELGLSTAQAIGAVARVVARLLRPLLAPAWVRVLLTSIGVFAACVFGTVQCSGDPSYRPPADVRLVNDISGMNATKVGRVVRPDSVEEIAAAIKDSRGPISIGGGRFSQGGQVAYPDSLHFDMRSFNSVVEYRPELRQITVQAGMTWRQLQGHIDGDDLSVKIMQTYANFTVGGSISVNAHGRYVGQGPLIMSVKQLKVVLADGSIVLASPSERSDLFYGAIGGYGGLGVIAEATLTLAVNTKVERRTRRIATADYKAYFFDHIRDDPDVVFHNADLYPPKYDTALDVSWFTTDLPLTNPARLIPEHSDPGWMATLVDLVARTGRFGKWVRQAVFDRVYYSFDRVVWRNWEASYDAAEIEPPSRAVTTDVLREYFVPVARFEEFIPRMRDIFEDHDVNIVNVSIRHAHKDPGTLLAWAPQEMFAFVVYYRQRVDAAGRKHTRLWSQAMIDAVLEVGGTYYLPYQVLATDAQFRQAYPRAGEYFALKDAVDPEHRFRNALWAARHPAQQDPLETQRSAIPNYRRDRGQTFLTVPEWYLVFNPAEYAEFLGGGANPSDFPFLESIDEYWRLYDRVTAIAGDANEKYITMLQVIGVSTTGEFLIKGAYEATIGRFFRWTAGPDGTPEEALAAEAHQAYADFIQHTAWYAFEFTPWVGRMWSDLDFFGPNWLRKTERRLSFSLEFVIKAAYAEAMGFAAASAYEPEEGLIYATLRAPLAVLQQVDDRLAVVASDGDRHIVSIPRWGPFTEVVVKLAEAGVVFEDISGNHDIVVSLVGPAGEPPGEECGAGQFSSALVSVPGRLRWVQLVPVADLSPMLAECGRARRVEHVFDF